MVAAAESLSLWEDSSTSENVTLEKRALNGLKNYISNPIFLQKQCFHWVHHYAVIDCVITAMQTPHLWSTEHNFFSASQLPIASVFSKQLNQNLLEQTTKPRVTVGILTHWSNMTCVGLKGLWSPAKTRTPNESHSTSLSDFSWYLLAWHWRKLVHLRPQQHGQFTASAASPEINRMYCFTCSQWWGKQSERDDAGCHAAYLRGLHWDPQYNLGMWGNKRPTLRGVEQEDSEIKQISHFRPFHLVHHRAFIVSGKFWLGTSSAASLSSASGAQSTRLGCVGGLCSPVMPH